MSGRTRTTLSDGRRVTGYRKTLAQRGTATPAHEMPFYRLSFPLPGALALLASFGAPTNVLGTKFIAGGHVLVEGKDLDWVRRQAAKLIAELAKGHHDLDLGTWQLARGENASEAVYRSVYTAGPAVVMFRAYEAPLIFPAGR